MREVSVIPGKSNIMGEGSVIITGKSSECLYMDSLMERPITF